MLGEKGWYVDVGSERGMDKQEAQPRRTGRWDMTTNGGERWHVVAAVAADTGVYMRQGGNQGGSTGEILGDG